MKDIRIDFIWEKKKLRHFHQERTGEYMRLKKKKTKLRPNFNINFLCAATKRTVMYSPNVVGG